MRALAGVPTRPRRERCIDQLRVKSRPPRLWTKRLPLTRQSRRPSRRATRSTATRSRTRCGSTAPARTTTPCAFHRTTMASVQVTAHLRNKQRASGQTAQRPHGQGIAPATKMPDLREVIGQEVSDAEWRAAPDDKSNGQETVCVLACTGKVLTRISAGQDLDSEYPRQDSNLRTRLRRPLLYPLSYGGSSRCRGDRVNSTSLEGLPRNQVSGVPGPGGDRAGTRRGAGPRMPAGVEKGKSRTPGEGCA